MRTNTIPTSVLTFLADEDDYNEAGDLTEATIAKLTAEAQKELTADDIRTIDDFGKRFKAALHSLAKPSDYIFGQITKPAFMRLFDDAWKRARPEAYEQLRKLREAKRMLAQAIADGVLEYCNESHTRLREGPNYAHSTKEKAAR